MGYNVDRLKQIVDEGPWHVPLNAKVRDSMGELSHDMRAVLREMSSGWTGSAALNAREIFEKLESAFTALQEAAHQVETVVEAGNHAFHIAEARYHSILGTSAEDTLASLTPDDDGNVVFRSVKVSFSNALDFISNAFGRDREREATDALTKLHNDLIDPCIQLNHSTSRLNINGTWSVPDPIPIPDPITQTQVDPGYPFPDSGGPVPIPIGIGMPDPDPEVTPTPIFPVRPFPRIGDHGPNDPSVSVDSGDKGSISGPGAVGIGAAGVGGAALAGGARLGSSGLAGSLGAHGGLDSGLGGNAVGAGASGRGGSPTGMMGGGQGGAGEKSKRRGLGGPMAPRLEDDEELGPRSAGASAGGRGQSVED